MRIRPVDGVDECPNVSAARYEFDTRRNMKDAQEVGDSATAMLLQMILVSVENNLWFLEAYLEGIAVRLHGRKLPPWTAARLNQTGSSS